MHRIETVYIVGLGAMGAIYASKFHEALPGGVRVVAGPERKARYEREGVRVNGKACRFTYVTPEEGGAPGDLIFVAVKYHDLEAAIAEMAPFIGPDTVIVSIMNGIDSEDLIGAAWGKHRMLRAMAVAIDAQRKGREISYTTLGTVFLGRKEDEASEEALEAVSDLLERSGVPFEVPENIMKSIWWKFMINVGMNQMTAVMRAPYGVIVKIPEAKALVAAAMREVVAISRENGIGLEEGDIDRFMEEFLPLNDPKGMTSMHQDVEAGRKTEVEMFARTVMDLGEAYGVPVPVNTLLYNMIRVEEKRRELKL